MKTGVESILSLRFSEALTSLQDVVLGLHTLPLNPHDR